MKVEGGKDFYCDGQRRERDEQATMVFPSTQGLKSLFVPITKGFKRSCKGTMQGYSISSPSTRKALLGIKATAICQGMEGKHSHKDKL